MCIAAQTALLEELAARTHQTCIVIIDILHIEPRANAIVGQRTAPTFKAFGIARQNIAALLVAICARTTLIGRPKVQIVAVAQTARNNLATLNEPQP